MARTALTTISDKNPIGMIVDSMLTEAQFQALNGTGWILADGRNIGGSAYATITGQTTAPDLRGIYRRGKNNGRSDGNQDVAGERTLGNFQNDAMQGHIHQFTTFFNAGYSSAGASQGTGGSSGPGNTVGPVNDGVNGGPRTAAETRVKNLAVNVFIKINE
jgi:hypothetical protein